MGRFDYVHFTMACPTCGTAMKEFQSKDGPCTLGCIAIADVRDFYDLCQQCGTWVEFSRPLMPSDLTGTSATKEEAEALGFVMTIKKLSVVHGRSSATISRARRDGETAVGR